MAYLACAAMALSAPFAIRPAKALVGDLGSSVRSVYTAVGTCINLASRLQEVARDIGEVAVVGPLANGLLAAQRLRPLGQASVRGMAHPIDIFAIDAAPPA